MLYLSGSVQARYALEKYPEEIRLAHEHGYLHIHDLSFGLAGYCAGWSLRDLLLEGFNLEGRCSSGPAKHFDSALDRWLISLVPYRMNGQVPRPLTIWIHIWLLLSGKIN